MDIAVSLAGVRKVYRQRQRSERLADVFTNLVRPKTVVIEALRGVDLTVTQGEIVTLIGANGEIGRAHV